MLGQLLLAISRSALVRRSVSGFPLTRKVVDRFVAGESAEEAQVTVERLRDANLAVTVDHLGEETRDADAAARTAKAYITLLESLRPLELGSRAEVSVKL